MLQPEHLRSFQTQNTTPRRIVSIGLVGLFHLFVIYAFASGLANRIVQKLPEEIKAEVVPPKLPDVKPPPPPPPDLTKPPPPFVPPPEIVIQTETPPTNTITVQHQIASVPPPKPQGITAPASIGVAHVCPQERWYPSIAVRLGQQGTTTLAFRIQTDGSITDITIAQSSGYSSLDDAAVRCASAWRYRPAMENGQAVVVPWKAFVKWQLK